MYLILYLRAKHGQLPFRLLNDLFCSRSVQGPVHTPGSGGGIEEIGKDLESGPNEYGSVCCLKGHRLRKEKSCIVRAWICDATREADGCLCGDANYVNVEGETRYRCRQCDFDYCGKCYHRKLRDMQESNCATGELTPNDASSTPKLDTQCGSKVRCLDSDYEAVGHASSKGKEISLSSIALRDAIWEGWVMREDQADYISGEYTRGDDDTDRSDGSLELQGRGHLGSVRYTSMTSIEQLHKEIDEESRGDLNDDKV